MSVKSTTRITRARAIEVLTEEIPKLPNKTIGNILDMVAESEHSHFASEFDNFIVTDVAPDIS